MIYYKVTNEIMQPLGLRRNPSKLQYLLNQWVDEPFMCKPDKSDDGGIWCLKTRGNANKLKKYFETRYGPARIFTCFIGDILFENNYRVKVDRMRLLEEIMN